MGRKLKYNKQTIVKRVPKDIYSIIDRISKDA